MHKSCAENLYLHFVLPVLFNNIWSANGWGGGRSGKRKVGERKRNTQAVEILRFLYRMLPLLASPLPSLFVRLRKFCIFPLCTCFSAAREADGVSCSCKLFVLFQVPNNLTTKILNFCLNCRQCVLQLLCVCVRVCVLVWVCVEPLAMAINFKPPSTKMRMYSYVCLYEYMSVRVCVCVSRCTSRMCVLGIQRVMCLSLIKKGH